MFLRRGAFLALKNSSPLKKKGVLQTRLGLESREGRIWMSMKVDRSADASACLSLLGEEEGGKPIPHSVSTPPPQILNSLWSCSARSEADITRLKFMIYFQPLRRDISTTLRVGMRPDTNLRHPPPACNMNFARVAPPPRLALPTFACRE